MKYSISKKFNLKDILLFTLPTIATMIFTSLYTIVDGIFVSRFVGSDALSAVNIVYPALNVIMGIGIMIGTGGSAMIGKRLGEQKQKEARQTFTLITVFAAILGILCSVIVFFAADPISKLLGASVRLEAYSVSYLQTYALFMLPAILQVLFQMLLVTAGKPNLSLLLTIGSGVANMALDYVLIVGFDLGIAGAALGTGISCMIGALPACIYFAVSKGSLRFTRFKFDGRAILRTLSNGSSEMVSNVAMGVITFLFNLAMLKLAGEEGVAAMTIVMYSQFLFSAMHIGFANGIAPVFSFNYGSRNSEQLKSLFKKCFGIIMVSTVFIVLAAFALAEPVVLTFTGERGTLYDMTLHGFRIFIWNFLFAGINIFASAFFTALSNGKISALISFLRTFVVQVVSILTLPLILGIDGLWLAVPIAELFAVFVSMALLIGYRKVYGYL